MFGRQVLLAGPYCAGGTETVPQFRHKPNGVSLHSPSMDSRQSRNAIEITFLDALAIREDALAASNCGSILSRTVPDYKKVRDFMSDNPFFENELD
jgi:hypothetical protein